MSTPILVCSCGLRLKAPGARPGRVGKCPRCGTALRFPEEERVEAPPVETAGAFVRNRQASRARPRKSRFRARFDPPKSPEVRWVESLFYPFWNITGVAVLVVLPVLLGIAAAPIASFLTPTRLGVILLIPQWLVLVLVGGYVLLFLGEVLVSSALGEVTPPRTPTWAMGEIVRGLGRWFWAILIGLGVGGLPAFAYWITCGDLDWFERIILVELLVPGLAYAQMALLASLIHDSPLAANPITVTRAILRVGWSYLRPCLETGGAIVFISGLFFAVHGLDDGLFRVLAVWFFWFVALYTAMVSLRRLGLFCYRAAVVLAWFPDRTRRARPLAD
jgi:hypothetical protein